MGWFLGIAAILMVFAFYNQERMKAEKEALAKRDVFDDIQDLVDYGDFNRARTQLFKVAYTMIDVHVDANVKARFTDFMTRFASVDPLYIQIMAQARIIIAENPGVIQSKLYAGEEKVLQEHMRYVFYFAEKLGEIERIKKGSSYQLYLAKPKKYLP